MPYSLNELGEIVADADGVSWADASKQQRALRANESRVAAMYAELDAVEEEEQTPLTPAQTEIVRVVMEQPQENPLTASVVQALDTFTRRMEAADRITEAMVSVLDRETVVNVEAPNVSVEQPAITIEQPSITVEQPDVHVSAPNVSINPEIVLPSISKTITFERDFDGRVTKADVVEGGDVT